MRCRLRETSTFSGILIDGAPDNTVGGSVAGTHGLIRKRHGDGGRHGANGGGRRLGYHHLPTTLVLTFDADVNRKAVENLGNYKIVGPKGNIIALKSAVYDGSKHHAGRCDPWCG